MIEIDSGKIKEAEELLKDVQNGTQRAVYNAINRGLSSAKTQSTKYVKENYNIKSSNIKENIDATVKRANKSNMVGTIDFSGHSIPLIQFKVSPSTPKKGVVKASVKKGSNAKLLHAYIADLGKGTGVFERMTKERNSSKELYGLSVPTMLGNENVYKQLEDKTVEVVNARLDHEIERILNGYGVK